MHAVIPRIWNAIAAKEVGRMSGETVGSVRQRLEDKTVIAPSGCQVYTGKGDPHVQVKVDGRAIYVHRLVWEMANGPIPVGLCVLHRCDNPPCIRLDHLWLGTRADNNRDRASKGRSFMRDSCLYGHPYTAENTSIARDGARACRVCHRETQQKYLARKSGESN